MSESIKNAKNRRFEDEGRYKKSSQHLLISRTSLEPLLLPVKVNSKSALKFKSSGVYLSLHNIYYKS